MVNSYGANQKTIKLYHILNGKVKGGATPQKIKHIAFQPRKCYNILTEKTLAAWACHKIAR